MRRGVEWWARLPISMEILARKRKRSLNEVAREDLQGTLTLISTTVLNNHGKMDMFRRG